MHKVRDKKRLFGIESKSRFTTFLARFRFGNFFSDIFAIIRWAIFLALYQIFLLVIFSWFAPVSNPVISENAVFWVLSYLFPTLFVIITVHSSAPRLEISGFKWRFDKIYIFLALIVFFYSSVLYLIIEKSTAFFIFLTLLVFAFYILPTIRLYLVILKNSFELFYSLFVATLSPTVMTLITSDALFKAKADCASHLNLKNDGETVPSGIEQSNATTPVPLSILENSVFVTRI